MAEVGGVTPGKPIWPGHHGGEGVERVTPAKDEEQGKKRQPPGDQGGGRREPGADGEGHGHVDEYV